MADQINQMDVEILPDGTIKVTTGGFKAVDHMCAEAFMKNLSAACGEKQERKHKHGVLGAAAHALAHALGRAHTH